MAESTTPTASFLRSNGRQVTAGFEGGEITSDGSALLLRKLDDARASRRCQHRAETTCFGSASSAWDSATKTATIIMPSAATSHC